jgi:hypothetical protein
LEAKLPPRNQAAAGNAGEENTGRAVKAAEKTHNFFVKNLAAFNLFGSNCSFSITKEIRLTLRVAWSILTA